MKKTLVTLAALAMASVAQAAELPAANDSGDLWVGNGGPYDLTTSNVPSNGLLLNTGETAKLSVAEGTTVSVKLGGYSNTNNGSYSKEGAGTLEVTGLAWRNSENGHTSVAPVNATVNAGTLKVTYHNEDGFVQESATVNAGATLQLNTNEVLGDMTVNLNGAEGKTATMQMNDGCYQVLKGTLNLNGNASVTGDAGNGLIEEGGKIVASGDNNLISSTLSIRTTQEIEVKEGGKLTLSGTIKANQYASGETTNDRVIQKTGEGTLVLGGNLSFEGNGAKKPASLDIDAGALDLTAVTTLWTPALDLADGTTLILGNQAVSMPQGTLTMTGNITIDLSAWCANVDTEGYTTFTPYMTLFTFGLEDTSFLDALDGMSVTIKLHDCTTNGGTLKVSGNSLQLVPEPATATLSLLALAGLAARRRRK